MACKHYVTGIHFLEYSGKKRNTVDKLISLLVLSNLVPHDHQRAPKQITNVTVSYVHFMLSFKHLLQ